MEPDMAGDWIKMRTDLADDPAVIYIASAMSLDEDSVVGKLHRLWSWADRQTADGGAVGVSKNWIDRYLSCEGFADAMAAAGWLTVRSRGVSFPRFDRHNGESAKRRANTARRVALHRSKHKAETDTCNAPVTNSALAREEKRREEKRRDSRLPSPSSVPCGADATADATVDGDLDSDWEEAKRLANEYIKPVVGAPKDKRDREMGLKIAYLVASGVIAEHGLHDSLDIGSGEKKAKRPWAVFWFRLCEHVGKGDRPTGEVWLKQKLATTRIPAKVIT